MPRDLVVGNGTLLVNMDRNLWVRDLYYPHVGLHNHVNGHVHRIGVWVDGQFSWLDNTWAISLGYRPGTLTTECHASNGRLGVSLRFNDIVHPEYNLFLRRVTVENLHTTEREIRLFFHHDFRINETDIGDTVFFHPFTDSMIHFKRDCWILMSGRTSKEGIYEYTAGIKEFGGAEGTWRDAEDGHLSKHPIDQGSVDSTISFRVWVPGEGRATVDCWLVVGRSLDEVTDLNARTLRASSDELIAESERHWATWLKKGEASETEIDPNLTELYERSLLTLQTQIDRCGGILAANDTDIMQTARAHYSYIWPRDGALVARALDMAGHPDPARRYFSFCAGILPPERPYFLHKYCPDGTLGATWHPWIVDGKPEIPCQQDGSALVVWSAARHCQQYKEREFMCSIYEDLIAPAADQMVHTLDPQTNLPRRSYDLWEQSNSIHLFTSGAVYGALNEAMKLAKQLDPPRVDWYRTAKDDLKKAVLARFYDERLGRFVRSLAPVDGKSEIRNPQSEMENPESEIRNPQSAIRNSLQPDPTLDVSMCGVWLFGLLAPDDERVKATMQAIYDRLWVRTPIGGMARHEDDYYFRVSSDVRNVPGNPWFISTLWMAEWYIAVAESLRDLEPARELLQWTARYASEAGLLAEQINPFTGEPLSVMPLTWSHAQYVTAFLKYRERVQEFSSRKPEPA